MNVVNVFVKFYDDYFVCKDVDDKTLKVPNSKLRDFFYQNQQITGVYVETEAEKNRILEEVVNQHNWFRPILSYPHIKVNPDHGWDYPGRIW